MESLRDVCYRDSPHQLTEVEDATEDVPPGVNDGEMILL